MNATEILLYIGIAIVIYYVSIMIFDFILRGFSPFITSRPWLVDQINDYLKNVRINNSPGFKGVSLGSGRSGFFASIERKHPDAKLEGYEKGILYFVLSWFQMLVKRSNIKVKRSHHFHRVKVSDADLIYCYAPSSKTIRELGDKFKFECRPGTVIISNGFVVPFLNITETIEINELKSRYAFLSKNRFFLKKNKRANKENKIYVYII